MSESFPPAERLRKRSEFLTVQSRGTKLATPNLLLFVMSGSAFQTRIGITASKKVGKAVERNRIKRRLRELYRRNKCLFPEGKDIVIVARRSALAASHQQLLMELRKALQRYAV
jgi:ribonuclease P protein component